MGSPLEHMPYIRPRCSMRHERIGVFEIPCPLPFGYLATFQGMIKGFGEGCSFYPFHVDEAELLQALDAVSALQVLKVLLRELLRVIELQQLQVIALPLP